MEGGLIGLGLDAVDVERFRRVLARRPAVAERLFTDDERAYGNSAVDPATRLAARFAAKEAVMKALGVGLGAFDFHEVEVVRDAATGRPGLQLHGRAATLAAEQGVTQWKVSLTHTDLVAEAVVAAL